MKFKAIVLTLILSFFYPFTFLSRLHKNRITFISLEHDNLSKDFKILYEALAAEQRYELKTLLFKFKPTFLGNLRYGLACIRQLFIIQSSKLVIIDYNNFVISKFPHRSKVKVLEVWHATGALKNFGNKVERDYEVKNYDYVIANSDFFKKIYAEAFNLSEKNVLVTGIPNNDKIFDSDFVDKTRKRRLEKYPFIENKTVITYAPTFRGRISTHFREVAIDLERVQKALGSDYIIIYKAHPLIPDSRYADTPNVLFIEDELISSIFCVSDVLITDYSAIAIDWMIFDKPVVAYVPDFKKYSMKPGLTIDYRNEFPGQLAFNEDDLIRALQSCKDDEYKKKRSDFFKKTYQYSDGKSTGRVISMIHSIMNDAL
ncbi:MAG TPA: teichoic acid biosynthesis protein B [Lactococcus sp.]|nr:teichoic acid biosynthesis protein B [Lactococcus sp.]